MVGSDEQGRQRTGWSGGGRRAGIALIGAAVLALGAAALATGATSKGYGTSLGSFKTHNLVSDQAGKADVMDKSLVNAHIEDLLRDARRSRAAALLPGPTRHRTPRRRPAWWLRGTVRARPAA